MQWPQPGCGNTNYLVAPPDVHNISQFDGDTIMPDYVRNLGHQQYQNFITQIGSDFQFLEKLHVWVIGKVVYDAATLHDEFWGNATDRFSEFQQYGNKQMNDFSVDPFQNLHSTNRSPYSPELIRLITDCVNPNVHNRIDLNTLNIRTRNGMRLWDATWLPDCEDRDVSTRENVDHPKLYYRANDINIMPEGNQPFLPNATDYDDMQEWAAYDPDWPALRLPFDRLDNNGVSPHVLSNANTLTNPRIPNQVQQNHRVVNGQIQHVNQLGGPNQVAPLDYSSDSSMEDPDEPNNVGLRKTTLRNRKTWTYVVKSTPATIQNRAFYRRMVRLKQRGLIQDNDIHFARSRNAARHLAAAQVAQERIRPPNYRDLDLWAGYRTSNTFMQMIAQGDGPTQHLIRDRFAATRLTNGPSHMQVNPGPTNIAFRPRLPNSLENARVFYDEVYELAIRGRIPPIPPGIMEDDPDFHWERDFQHYVTTVRGILYWWDAGQSSWYKVGVWPNTAQNRAMNRVGKPAF